jgi:hypothetical protein
MEDFLLAGLLPDRLEGGVNAFQYGLVHPFLVHIQLE